MTTHPALRELDLRTRPYFSVALRHLAGAGDPRHVTHALTAAGWETVSDPGYPHVAQRSPDGRVSLVLEHSREAGGPLWQFAADHEAGGWHADLGGEIPVEYVAGFTDALLRPAPDMRPGAWQPLTSAGWKVRRDGHDKEHAASPDRRLSVSRRLMEEGQSSWRIELRLSTLDILGHDDGQTFLWRALFSRRTPPHLVTAFMTALAEAGPVQRSDDPPYPHLATMTSGGPQGEALADAHAQRLRSIQAAASAASGATPPPPQPPTAPGQHR